MKKSIFLFFIFINLVLIPSYSQSTEETAAITQDVSIDENTEANLLETDDKKADTPAEKTPIYPEIGSEIPVQYETEEQKPGFFDRGRTAVAFGIDLGLSASNSYFTIKDFLFNKNHDQNIEVDFNAMSKKLPSSGFSLAALADFKIYLDIYIKSKAEFGFFSIADAYAFGSMPKSIINLLAKGNTDNKVLSGKFTATGSAFAGTGLFYGMKIKNLKFRVSAVYFIPAFYVPYDGIEYNFENGEDGKVRLKAGGELNVYTHLPLFKGNQDFNTGSMFKSAGFDLSFEGSYSFHPIADLNFSLKNIPIFPAKMDKGASFKLSTEYEIESAFTYIDSIINKKPKPEIKEHPFEMKEDSHLKRINIFRPIKLSVGADIFPFSNRYLIISPNLGFQFLKPFYVDAGVKLETNFLKVFGVYYSLAFEDRVWKNRGGTFVDLRLFRLETSISSASPSFAGSFTGSGVELGISLVFGY